MSGSTAELTAPVLPTRRWAGFAALGNLTGARLYLALGGGALVIAALSLLIPSTPSYDPWAWLVWGREIIHVKLHTDGGPTWKPLPVMFTTVFALFGKAQPNLWLIIARAGAVMAAAMVFRVSWRLTKGLGSRLAADGASSLLLTGPALLAGTIAAVGLVFSGGFISDNALGYSEGLMTALVLIAVERHLDGKPRQAFVVAFFAALDRPEIWLFWGPYGLWLFWRDPDARKLVIGLFALIPILWFLPEYWGSGHFLRGAERAQHVRSNSPALKACPFCAELVDHAWPTVLLRIKIAAALAVGIASWILLRGWRAGKRRFDDPREHAMAGIVIAGLLGLGWFVLIGIMTQAGFSGNNRYLVLGSALVEIAGAAGWGWLALELPGWGRRALGSRGSWLAGARGLWSATAVLTVFFALFPGWVANSLIDIPRTHRALVYQAKLRSGMAAAITKLGGSSKILACGSVMTEGFQVPMLAWMLGVRTVDVQASPLTMRHDSAGGPSYYAGVTPPNVIFQTRAQRKAHLLPVVRGFVTASYTYMGHTKTFRLYENCSHDLKAKG